MASNQKDYADAVAVLRDPRAGDEARREARIRKDESAKQMFGEARSNANPEHRRSAVQQVKKYIAKVSSSK